MAKRFILFTVLIFSIFSAGAQSFELRRGNAVQQKTTESEKTVEVPAEEEKEQKAGEEPQPQTPEKKEGFSLKSFSPDYFVTFGPVLLLNTDNTTSGAPSPICYSGSFGIDFVSEKSSIYFQPKLAFFSNYYLWDGEHAQPAEIENRTATVLSFIFDLCAGYSWEYKRIHFAVGGGLGILARIGILSNGVESSDINNITGTKASDDVGSINSDFYKNMNFLYPELNFSLSKVITRSCKAGIDARIYLPLGSLISGNGMDSLMGTVAFKFNFPHKSEVTAVQ